MGQDGSFCIDIRYTNKLESRVRPDSEDQQLDGTVVPSGAKKM